MRQTACRGAPGNRNVEQPAIPGASVRRTKAGKIRPSMRKYEKVRELLATDTKLMAKIKSTARAYGIDPIHIIGALVGEHTYNVDAYDRPAVLLRQGRRLCRRQLPLRL